MNNKGAVWHLCYFKAFCITPNNRPLIPVFIKYLYNLFGGITLPFLQRPQDFPKD